MDFLRDSMKANRVGIVEPIEILGSLSSLTWCSKARSFFSLDSSELPLIEPTIALETACNDLEALVKI